MDSTRPGATPSADRGQAAVELALALPVVALLALGIVQLVVIAAERLAVDLAAREGARAAAVSTDPAAAAADAASGATRVAPLDVSTSVGDGTVSVTVTHHSPTDVPVIGRLLGAVEVRATVTMALEPP